MGCIFCRIANGEIASEKFMESSNFFAIRDANPRTEGHSLIISKKHYEDFLELPDKLGSELVSFAKEVAKDLAESGFAEGFNLVVNNGKSAGQVVMHLHFHILPRKEGDGFEIFG